MDVQFSRSISSDSLWPHGWQHVRLPCPTPAPGAFSNSCPLLPSNHLILCCLLLLLSSIFPSIRVFSNGSVLRIRWPRYCSFSFSISPSNEYLGLISFSIEGLISLQSKGLSRVFFNTTDEKHQFFSPQLSLWLKTFKNILGSKRTEKHGLNEPESWTGFLRNLLHNLKEINPQLSVSESLMTPLLANTLKWGTVANIWVRTSGSKWDKEWEKRT